MDDDMKWLLISYKAPRVLILGHVNPLACQEHKP